MNVTEAHKRLAAKFMHKPYWEAIPVPHAMQSLVALAFSEEEAELVVALSFATVPASIVARRVKRPVEEVAPLLDSLADRLLITGLTIKGVKTYGFLNFLPGLFEAQMIRAKAAPEGSADRARFVKFAALYEDIYHEVLTWLKPHIDGKDVRLGRIVPVFKSIEVSTGVIPLASDRFADIIDRNNSFCLVNVCPCRYEMELLGKGCGKPLDVCSAMGRLADFCIDKGIARRVSKQEYIDAKTRAAEAGLVNMTDNLLNPLQVCSCCSCCCSALRILKDHNIPTLIASSHYEAAVDDAACNACGKCAKRCPMDAITWTKKQPPAQVNYARCIGCGLCVTACDKERAMTLRERPDHKPPSKTLPDFYVDRALEIKGEATGLRPRLTLGFSRLLGKVAPFSVSGPGYRPPDQS